MAKYSDEQVKMAVLERRLPARYPFPGDESVQIGVRALTDDQLDDARAAAALYVKERQIDLVVDPEFFDRALHREVVLRSVVDPDSPDRAPFFESAAQVREMDSLLVRSLYELCIHHQQAADPYAHVTGEEVEALVAQLGKSNDSVARLSLFDRPTLVSFVLSMASLLREKSATPKSNTG